MRTSKNGLLLLSLALGWMPCAMAQSSAVVGGQHAAVPYPNRATPKAVDLGALSGQSGATPISVTVALSLPRLADAEDLLKSINTPGNPQYHQFLTAEQFAARFAPADADVAKVIASLAKYKLAASRTGATTLSVTGLPADMERAFAVSLHAYEVPAHGNEPGYSFHAPLTHATAPSEISASVTAVVGLDTRPNFRPLHVAVPASLNRPRATTSPSATGNPPGLLTVSDFANYYDVQPLYRRGVSGSGSTIGIVTLASFTPSDAFAYWGALGLSVKGNRIKVVDVDGGPGAPSDASGSIETTLDVEQSGGIAPGAKMIVYQAPNTNQGFVDGFATAIDSNKADSLSVSWGFWEWYQNLENSPVTDPMTGRTVGITQAFHELFLRAAIQGQTLFAASGDGGAYDINNDFGCTPPDCSLTLSVDNPASDPAMTAAGGTTLPGTQSYCLNSACTPPYYNITIAQESVWGWDYLDGLCSALGAPNPIACGIFPGGSGGGVSILFGEPLYQYFVSGVQRSQPGQNWVLEGQLVYALPANYRGRNVPDISFNADPETGYVIYYTSDKNGFGIASFYGGTSFVAPQLNGVTALLGQYLNGRRIGLLNYALYGLASSGQGYRGPNAPLHAITTGDNWFYYGRNGYSPAAGLGTLDVANFAQYLRDPF
ncbi:MAG: S53 family peptidase [Candidatus Acidiferrum sp.]